MRSVKVKMVFKKVGDVLDNVKQIPVKINEGLKAKQRTNIFKLKKKYNNKREVAEDDLRKIAEYKVMFKKSILMHLFWFVAVNIMLVAINLIFSPVYLWFIYALIGWPIIGIIMHGTAYVLFSRGVIPGDKRGLIYHIASYLSVIPVLIIINILAVPAILWVFYPVFFWGVGLVFHIAIYSMMSSGKTVVDGIELSKKEMQIEREIQRMKSELKQKA